MKKRDIVLKFFNPILGGDRYRRECFDREGEILIDLAGQRHILPMVHPLTAVNIDVSGIPIPLSFYASHLAKHSVKDYIYNHTRKQLRSIQYFRGICKAVQRIHRKGICHRDLKPEQFLVFSSGYVCLADFGTARYVGSKTVPILSNYQVPSGDLRYTAPELLSGLHFSDAHNFSADIYSLGCILFELFTQTVLTLNLLTISEINQLIVSFQNVSEKDRIKVFEGFIPVFASKRPLPSVRQFDLEIPRAVAYEIDRLYRSLASIDPKMRVADFGQIFLRINIIEKIIRNLKQYEEWRRLKSLRRKG